MKEHLKRFQGLKATDESFIPTLRTLMDGFSQHIQTQSSHTLPMLQSVINDQESRSLAQQFEHTKMFVPSRVHDEMSSKPPFDNVVGLLAAPLDRLANMFRKWPKDEPREDKGKKKEKVYIPPGGK